MERLLHCCRRRHHRRLLRPSRTCATENLSPGAAEVGGDGGVVAREGIGGHVIVVGVVVGGVDDDVDVDDNGPESANVARRIGTVEGSERERGGWQRKKRRTVELVSG